MDYFINHFQVIVLIFARVLGILIVAPFFSSGIIPIQVRVILTVFITFIIYPVLTKFNPVIPTHLINYGLLIIMQLMIGLILGFIVTVIFTAFQLAAQYFSFQMGLGINEVYDPLSQIEIPVIGQMQSLLMILVFLALNGHHLLLDALFQSFTKIPLVNFTNPTTMQFFTNSLAKIFSEMFILSLKISFPILATMVIVSVVLGLLSKASPQMNIFMLGFPLQIGIGFIVLIIATPFIIELMGKTIDYMFKDLLLFIGSVK